MAYNPNNPNGSATSANSAPVVIASDQIVPVGFPSYALDAFNQVTIAQRTNDFECVFAGTGTLTTLVTPVYTGSGSGTWSGGQVLYSTGTTNPSTVSAQSLGNITYTPGAELYAYFTGVFTAGVAGTFQRIGLTDKVNGFFIGYEGTVFSVSIVTNSAITSIGQSSFNIDTLTGAAGSKFTRAGVPEAINFTFQNVFRVRFGWVGSASIVYEVLSPDDQWVIYHINRNPNTQSLPSIQNPNLPITLWMSSNGTNLVQGTSCWAAGSSSPFVQKGVSSGGYMPSQDAKDSGRTYMTFYIDAIAGVTTEALVTMNINAAGTVTTGTSYTVPAGKTLRLTAINSTVKTTNGTAQYGRIRVRAAAAVAASSGIVMNTDVPVSTGSNTAAGWGTSVGYTIPDGLEIAAGQQIGISQLASATTTTVSTIVTGFLY